MKVLEMTHCASRNDTVDADLEHRNVNIELASPKQLRPYPNNARTHTRKQIRQIADSITQFGFTNPVLIDDAGQIIAGHGRVEAAKLLGLAAVPTIKLSHLSTAEKRAYIIADNRLAEKAGWDREVLAIELQALIDVDFDVELTGFEAGEIDLTLADADDARREEGGPEDRIPEPAAEQVVSRAGDLWLLGSHRLLCGDARDPAAYSLLLDGEKAGFVFSDPPFNVAVNGHASRSQRHGEFAMASGEMTAESFTEFLKGVFGQLVAHSEDGSVHDLCMDWRHIGEMLAAGNASYTELLNVCVWAKSHFGMGGFYRSQHELVFIWKGGEGPHRNNLRVSREGRSRSNVWNYPGTVGRRDELAMHPTVKPVALVADAIKDCSARGGIVLDPFMGSGTTLIAAERTGRRGRGIEINPIYVDVAARRWQSYTGKAAVLKANGLTFEQVAEQRAQACSALGADAERVQEAA
jgi:DNA modification methylase